MPAKPTLPDPQDRTDAGPGLAPDQIHKRQPRKAETYRAARRAADIKAAKRHHKAARAVAIAERVGYAPKPEQGPNGQHLAAHRRFNQARVAAGHNPIVRW